MAEKDIENNQTPIESRESIPDKVSKWGNFFGMVAGAIAILTLGFYIGKWVSDIEHRNELLKAELDCQTIIYEERKKCEQEKMNENKLNTILTFITNMEGGKNENK